MQRAAAAGSSWRRGSRRPSPRLVEPGHLALVAFAEPARYVELSDWKRFGAGDADQVKADIPRVLLERRRQRHQSRSDRTAMNASWGISTWPTRFIRFLPSACFS